MIWRSTQNKFGGPRLFQESRHSKKGNDTVHTPKIPETEIPNLKIMEFSGENVLVNEIGNLPQIGVKKK